MQLQAQLKPCPCLSECRIMAIGQAVLCVLPQCDAINGDLAPQIWKQRCSFPVYIIAMSATAGATRRKGTILVCFITSKVRAEAQKCLLNGGDLPSMEANIRGTYPVRLPNEF